LGDLLEMALAEGYGNPEKHHIIKDVSKVVDLVIGIKTHLEHSFAPPGYRVPTNMDLKNFARALLFASTWHKHESGKDRVALGSAIVDFAMRVELEYQSTHQKDRERKSTES
jgi:hypothetical protein